MSHLSELVWQLYIFSNTFLLNNFLWFWKIINYFSAFKNIDTNLSIKKGEYKESMFFYILDDIFFGEFTGNSIKMNLYKSSYFYIMKLSLYSFLCWLLIRSAETYYGDSLKEVVLNDK